MQNLISISGKINSGKDTVGKMIAIICNEPWITNEEILSELKRERIWEYQIKKWAGKLRQIAGILLDVDYWRFDEREFKDSYLPAIWNDSDDTPITVRQFLQNLGTDALRDHFHKQVWINALIGNYQPDQKWIITDTRFPNELEAVGLMNGLTIRVVRDSEQLLKDKGIHIPKHLLKPEHESETDLDGAEFDCVIHNDGTLEELIVKVRVVCDKYILI